MTEPPNPDSQRRSAVVLKICDSIDWRRAIAAGRYHGSADDARDGFIHLSAPHQLAGTLNRHFAGRDGLLLVAFATDTLGEALRWEVSRGGDLFPHHYGPLDPGRALWVRDIALGQDGRHTLPELQ